MLLDRLSRWKFIQIALSVIITGTLIISLFGDNWITKAISALLSAVLLFLNTYFKNYDLGQLAQKHKDAADKLWNVRESYFSLLADMDAVSFVPETIIKRRDELQNTLAAIYSAAPRTTGPAYAKAQTALQKHEDLTFSDEEIDAFLPKELKRSKTSTHLQS